MLSRELPNKDTMEVDDLPQTQKLHVCFENKTILLQYIIDTFSTLFIVHTFRSFFKFFFFFNLFFLLHAYNKC